MIKHLLGVVVLLSITTASFAQEICPGPLTVTIEGSTTEIPLDVDGIETQPACNNLSGDLTGAVDITASGGSPVYFYDWDHIPTPDPAISDIEDLTGLGAGTYTVTVTDTQGCSGTAQFILVEPDPVTVALAQDPIDCSSLDPETGIMLTPGGGTEAGDYEYAWTGPAGETSLDASAQNQTGLTTAGTYNVTVTDDNGCTATAEIAVTVPDPITADLAFTQPTCNVASTPALDGTITISNELGGTPPYSYAWTGPGTDDADGANQTGLGTGSYTVIVSDALGCEVTLTQDLIEPTPVTVALAQDPIDCSSLDPETGIMLTPGGGTEAGDYEYAWTGPAGETSLDASAQNQTGLTTAGTYNVTVTDDNGCTATAEIAVTVPDPITADLAFTQPTCNVASTPALDGTITISNELGGTPPYSYAWTGPGTDDADGANQTGLGTGSYTVIVSDALGCEVTLTQDLIEPTPVTVALAQDPIDCSSLDPETGIMLTPGGGTEAGDYEYAWTGPAGETSLDASAQNQTGLTTAGTYNVTVTDDNGCTATAEIAVTVPDPITADLAFTQPTCNVASTPALDGTITISNELGGTPPYSYAWTGPGTDDADGANQTGLGTGSYTVIVSDALGCEVTLTQDLIEPTPVTVALAQDPIDCSSLDPETGIMLTPGGGTEAGDYEYAWTGPAGETSLDASAQNQTGLTTAGTYNVTVTDDNGCTATAEIAVTVPDPITADLAFTQPTCNVASTPALDGTITISNELGGTPPYSYAWTGPGTDDADGANQTGLGTGSYTVIVSDALGCEVTLTQDLIEPTPVTVALAQDPIDCSSLDPETGIMLTPGGGTEAGDYEYAWTGPAGETSLDASAQNQTGLTTAGTYNVTVTDDNGCTATAEIAVTVPDPITADLAFTQPTCNVASTPALDGTITISNELGGTPPYSYAWTGPGTDDADGANQTGLGTGSYTVIVSDALGCEVTLTQDLIEPTPVTVALAQDPIDCSSLDPETGIMLTPGGGTEAGDYEYAWTGPAGETSLDASAQNQTGLTTAGTYNVTVTDDNGCTATAEIAVTVPDPITADLAFTQPTCNVASTPALDGTITISNELGGTPPYSYAWTGPGTDDADGANQTGLGTGSYTVIVSDALGCEVTLTQDLIEPTPVTVALAQDPIDCSSLDPETGIMLTPGGGTEAGDYEYAWTGPAGETSLDASAQNQTGLTTAGTYNVTVTDDNGCTATAEIAVTVPDPITADLAFTQPTCNVASTPALDGTITISNELGGTPPYSYAWTGPGTDDADGANQTGLGTGSYTVIVSDALGCEVTLTQDLIEPTPVTVALAQDPIDCSSLDPETGIMLTPGGGTEAGDYEYAWTGPAGETSLDASAQNQTGLTTAGTYNVTVTDDNGCTATAEIAVTVPDPITADLAFTQPTCNVASTPALDGTITISNELGGTPPYSYAWTGPGTDDADGANQTGLGTGSYTVIVSDALGCEVTLTQDLIEPTPVTVALAQDPIDCSSLDPETGIMLTPGGGTEAGDYEYAWTGPAGETSLDASAQNQTGLTTAGTYNVTVTDDNGCTATAEIAVTVPDPITADLAFTQPTCNVASTPALDGTITISNELGGTPPYSYAWTGPGTDDADGANQTGLGTGSYTVIVSDALGCEVTLTQDLIEPTPVTVALAQDPIDCSSLDPETGIMLTPGGGTEAGDYEYAWTGPAGETSLDASAQNQTGLTTAGTYNVTVTDDNGCTATAEIAVTVPDPITADLAFTQPTCNVASTPALDGTITISNELGGTPPYSYAWTGPGTDDADGANQTGLGTGSYTVIVSDALGCEVTLTQDLIEPTPVTVALAQDPIDCSSLDPETGIMLTPGGGTEAGDYEYAWTGPAGETSLDASAQNQTGLTTAGTYNVTVTDDNGCTATAEIAVTVPDPITADLAFTQPTCNVASTPALDGTITISNELGGTPPYSYAWTGPGTDDADGANQTGLGTGSYTVIVSDALGCEVTLTQDLIEPTPVTVALAQDPIDCSSLDPETGIMLTPGGGTEAGDYEYAWTGPAGETSLDASAQNQTGLTTAGTYNVTVTDDNGCTATAEIAVTVPDPITADLAFTLPACNESSTPIVNGTITISNELGGTPPYGYAWTGPGTDNADGANQTGLGAGSYTVVISDALGCELTLMQDLVEPTPIVVTADTEDLSCNSSNGPADGEINVMPSGGQGSTDADYTYVWETTNGSGLNLTEGDQTELSAGLYRVTVSDANGCTGVGEWTLTEPPIITILASANDLLCHSLSGDPTGSIDISVTGGQGTVEADYNYVWTTTNGSGLEDGVADQTGLSAGTYNLSVTDSNGCLQTDTYVLEEPTEVEVVGTETDLSCNSESGDPTGAIDITTSGGQGTDEGDYTYVWTTTNGSGLEDGVADQTELSAGTYTVVVSDANNCTDTETWTLTEPSEVECSLDSPLVGAGSLYHILCAGDSTILTVTGSGGNGPYTFSDDGGITSQSDPDFLLPAGTHTITVYDANGCESTCEFTLTEPPVMTAGTCVVEDECQLNEGEIEVGAEGGVGPYTVTWTSPTGGTLNETSLVIPTSGADVTFTGAEGGETYIFVVTDANGCEL